MKKTKTATWQIQRRFFIACADGARKVRWMVKGQGKRSGVRVIYFNLSEQGVIYLLTLYQKSDKENISPNEIKRL